MDTPLVSCRTCVYEEYDGYAEPCKSCGSYKDYGNYLDARSPQETHPQDREKVASDGLSTSYYDLPPHATELRHVIAAKGMSFARGNLMKACYRLGEKSGTATLYDLNKMKFFVEDMIEMHGRGEHL